MGMDFSLVACYSYIHCPLSKTDTWWYASVSSNEIWLYAPNTILWVVDKYSHVDWHCYLFGVLIVLVSSFLQNKMFCICKCKAYKGYFNVFT